MGPHAEALEASFVRICPQSDRITSSLELNHAANVTGDGRPLLGGPLQNGNMQQHQNPDFQPLPGCLADSVSWY